MGRILEEFSLSLLVFLDQHSLVSIIFIINCSPLCLGAEHGRIQELAQLRLKKLEICCVICVIIVLYRSFLLLHLLSLFEMVFLSG